MSVIQNKVKFHTPYNFEDKYFTCAGTKTVDVLEAKKTGEKIEEYGYEYDYKEVYLDEENRKGDRELVIVGRHNVYDKIQSYKDDVDIYKILAKYSPGDIAALDSNKGFYADVSSMPKSFNDYHNKIIEGERIFNGLPIDFKQEFGNNLNAFMSSIYDKTFDLRFNNYMQRKNARNQQPVQQSVQQPVQQPVQQSV